MPALSQTRAYLALVLIVLLWGSYPATSKLALHAFPPSLLAALRVTIAAAFLTALLARGGAAVTRPLTLSSLGAFAVLAVAGIFGSTHLTYYAIHYSTASNAAILQAAAPVIVALAARLYLGERLRPVQSLGILLSALGLLIVITGGRVAALRVRELYLGDLINLVALGGWSIYTVYGRHVLASYSPALATTAAYGLGALLLVPTAALVAPLFPPPQLGSAVAWGIVVGQAVLGAVAHVWWYKAVEVVGASRAAIFMNLQPVVGVVLATLLLAERLGIWHVAGGALVLGGVALTTRPGATPSGARVGESDPGPTSVSRASSPR